MADIPGYIDVTTIPDYEKGAQDLCLRSRLYLAMLKRRGRITYNNSGTKCVWDVEYSRPQSTGYAGGQSLDFGNHSAYMQLESGWRGMVMTDSMDLMGHMMNHGDKTALVKVWNKKLGNCMKGLNDDFCGELFNDGSDATKPIGLRSFLTATTPVVGDKVATPNDTYGGKSTVLAAHGGSWETTSTLTSPNTTLANDWPFGRGRPEYDCTSPKLVNTVSTAWTGTNTWLANAWRVVDTTKTWMGVSTNVRDLMCMLAPNYWDDFRRNQEAKTQILLPHKESSDLGFPDTLNMDGMAIRGTDFDVPADTGFMLNLNTVEIKCMFDVLFKVITGETGNSTVNDFLTARGFDIDSLSNRIVVLFLGNVTYQPKFVAYFYPYASA